MRPRILLAGLLAVLVVGLTPIGLLLTPLLVGVQQVTQVKPLEAAPPIPLPPTQKKQQKSCISQDEVPFYYADLGPEDKENSDSFGPSGERIGPPTALHAVRVLYDRLCGTHLYSGDRKLFTALQATVFPNRPSRGANWIPPTNRAWGEGLRMLLANLDLVNADIVSLSKKGYFSLNMTSRRGLSPKVGAVHVKTGGTDRFLVIPVINSKVVLRLRIRCGFQPYTFIKQQVPIDLRWSIASP